MRDHGDRGDVRRRLVVSFIIGLGCRTDMLAVPDCFTVKKLLDLSSVIIFCIP
jgi:hypothetical protein